MARILTGIQSTGRPHLGNILGAIEPAVELSRDSSNESCFFIADLHSLTTLKDGETRKENTYAVAAAWLAFGFDTDNNLFYRQSDVPEVCELTWYLNCFSPLPMLENAHSYKDKTEKLERHEISAGLFDYPVLMASDILLYDADVVPTGKDQKQHLEITRDLANTFNNRYGETFVVPEPRIKEDVMTIPGLDGNKMSKSYENTIDIFLSKKKLRKNIMAIVTDSTPLEDPKDPDQCNVFQIYSSLASEEEIQAMREKYQAGNYGYGHAKQELFELILNKYEKERESFNYYMEHKEKIEEELQKGAHKARKIALDVLNRVRGKLGYQPKTAPEKV